VRGVTENEAFAAAMLWDLRRERERLLSLYLRVPSEMTERALCGSSGVLCVIAGLGIAFEDKPAAERIAAIEKVRALVEMYGGKR
jgi:hypothetical protein